MDHQLIIENIEDVDENGTTRGWIVPAGTEADALDLELEAVDHVDIPATEDPDQWRRNLTVALADAGWELNELRHDGPTITAPVKPRDRKSVADALGALNGYRGSDVWQDVIMGLPVDEDRTARLDPSGASNVVALRSGEVLRWDAARAV